MNQSDFNNAFTGLILQNFSPELSAQQIAYEVLRRDQWRTRIYAMLSLFFWLIGTIGMGLLVFGLNRLVIFMRIAPQLHAAAARGATTQAVAMNDQELLWWGTDFIHHVMPYAGGAVLALLLAALFTVLYVSSSRQATLTRINISLMQMSEELKRMREHAGQK
jgi:hypothetical protein